MSIYERLKKHNNDYSDIENRYSHITNDEFNKDPFGSIRTSELLECKDKVSIIIPCWKVKDTIEFCLKSIEISTFNLKFPDMLEVILIEDGVNENCLESIAELGWGMNIMVLKQKHLSRAHAINTGFFKSSGDIIIVCDSDILLLPNAIEELLKRQILFKDEIVTFGFRKDIKKQDIEINNFRNWMYSKVPEFWEDNRFKYDFSESWGTNMMLETNLLKNMNGIEHIWLSDHKTTMDDKWALYRMVYGFLFCISRINFEKIGGQNESFFGWGWEDSEFTAKAICEGCYIVPIPSSFALHIYHESRSKNQDEESIKNENLLYEVFNEEYKRSIVDVPQDRIISENIIKRSFLTKENNLELDNLSIRLKKLLEEPRFKANYNYSLGNLKVVIDFFKDKAYDLSENELEMYIDSLMRCRNKSLFKKLNNNYINREGFYYNLGKLFFGEKTSNINLNIFIEETSKEVYFNRFDGLEHAKRGKQYLESKRYYLAYIDFVASVLKGETTFEDTLEYCYSKLWSNE
ncbi:MAG: glycosyltransferase family 2 protein [Fusobacteriaceae bacterium]|nr:glycosyltransferase family 2 protein [Fusobacteriaceae bacterium]